VFEVLDLRGIEVLDSCGQPTVSVVCRLHSGATGHASVPSGRSTGSGEAVELRDGDPARFRGRGCRLAADAVGQLILPAVRGRAYPDQSSFDGDLLQLAAKLGSGALGANSVLGASIAFARAAAGHLGISLVSYFAGDGTQRQLPRPMINLFSGGLHGGAGVELQDLLVIPVCASSMIEVLEVVTELYAVAEERAQRSFSIRPHRADEGGLAPPFRSNRDVFEFAVECITEAGYRPGSDIAIAIDVAATHFVSQDGYVLDGEQIGSHELIGTITEWVSDYPVISVEDGLSENDPAWPELRRALPETCRVVGDDLLCTQVDRVIRARDSKAADALLLKVNQVGSLTQAAAAVEVARAAGWAVVASARSGETEDDWLADLAVGWGADSIKVGSVRQSERLAKYNRLAVLEAIHGWPMARFPASATGVDPVNQSTRSNS